MKGMSDMSTKKFPSYFQQFKNLEGKTIAEVRVLDDEEIDNMGWYSGGGSVPMVLIFTDGTMCIPMQDPEGNGAGALYVQAANDEGNE